MFLLYLPKHHFASISHMTFNAICDGGGGGVKATPYQKSSNWPKFMLVHKNHFIAFQRGVKNNSTIIFSTDIFKFKAYFTMFWRKNADVIRNYADKVQYLYIFGKYIDVATSMQKIKTVTLSDQKYFYPPPPIRLAHIKNPIQNRVKYL